MLESATSTINMMLVLSGINNMIFKKVVITIYSRTLGKGKIVMRAYLKVIDKLCKILNGIYIVVRRWADESYTSCRMSCNCNVADDLMTWELAPFAWFSTL